MYEMNIKYPAALNEGIESLSDTDNVEFVYNIQSLKLWIKIVAHSTYTEVFVKASSEYKPEELDKLINPIIESVGFTIDANDNPLLRGHPAQIMFSNI